MVLLDIVYGTIVRKFVSMVQKEFFNWGISNNRVN